jgi:anti-sigma factor RsiW
MTNETKRNDDAWLPCAAGEIQQFVRRRKNRRRAIFAAQLAGGAVFGGILALLVTGMPDFLRRDKGMPEYHYGGIACKDVQTQAQADMKGQLDPETAAKIREHLRQCPHCPELIEKMKKQNARNVRGDERRAFSAFADAPRDIPHFVALQSN